MRALTLGLAADGRPAGSVPINWRDVTLPASGPGFGADDDAELVGAAAPFGLKLIESVLAAVPDDRGLLLAATQGFVQYAYAFAEMKAEELNDMDRRAACRQRARAARLYLRARDYGLRGLEAAHPAITKTLRARPAAVLASTTREDVGILYWTGIAWAAAIALTTDDAFLAADLPVVEALACRVLALDEAHEHGATHVYMIGFEMGRAEASPGATDRARRHYARAIELTDGKAAAPYVAYAEAVSTATHNPEEFRHLLQGVLKMDVNARPEWRLVNVVMQRRAQWLLTRTGRFL